MIRVIIVAAALALGNASAGRADVIIRNDRGGEMRAYQARVESVRASGERVIVDGICASACTLFLNLPAGQLCATARARFIFHSAADAQFGIPDWRANEALMNAYPPRVRLEIGRRGGLWLTPIAISGTAIAPACRKASR